MGQNANGHLTYQNDVVWRSAVHLLRRSRCWSKGWKPFQSAWHSLAIKPEKMRERERRKPRTAKNKNSQSRTKKNRRSIQGERTIKHWGAEKQKPGKNRGRGGRKRENRGQEPRKKKDNRGGDAERQNQDFGKHNQQPIMPLLPSSSSRAGENRETPG